MNTQIQAHTIRRAIASETLSDVTSACRLLSASSVDEHGGLILVIGMSTRRKTGGHSLFAPGRIALYQPNAMRRTPRYGVSIRILTDPCT